jgi:predicted N-acetyltransferase YhbS
VECQDAPPRVTKGQGGYPIPVTILARLAVDISVQSKGVGISLLQDAMRKYLKIIELTGSRAILVHAMDSDAATFYAKWGFESSPISPLHLYMLGKDVRETIRQFPEDWF